jgi:DNA-binding LacI/PurR family transcriptional regulator
MFPWKSVDGGRLTLTFLGTAALFSKYHLDKEHRMASESRRPTLRSIAAACDVSVAAVSRILSKDPSFSAREEVRTRVLEEASRQNYKPNVTARNLRKGRTGIIGVFCRTGAGTSAAESPYLTGIEHRLAHSTKETFYQFVGTDGMPERPLPFRFDAAIFLQAVPAHLGRQLHAMGIPFVCVNTRVEGSALGLLPDERQGAGIALGHLRSLGHRRVAYLNAFPRHGDHFSVETRHGAIVDHCMTMGLDLVAGHDIPPASNDLSSTLDKLVREERATAVIAYNFMVAVLLVRAAHTSGISIPEELSVVSFDDAYPLGSLYPAVTVVGVAAEEAGKRGAEAALQLANGSPAPEEGISLLDYHLIPRESTAPPP